MLREAYKNVVLFFIKTVADIFSEKLNMTDSPIWIQRIYQPNSYFNVTSIFHYHPNVLQRTLFFWFVVNKHFQNCVISVPTRSLQSTECSRSWLSKDWQRFAWFTFCLCICGRRSYGTFLNGGEYTSFSVNKKIVTS